jgi:hypothetical protein
MQRVPFSFHGNAFVTKKILIFAGINILIKITRSIPYFYLQIVRADSQLKFSFSWAINSQADRSTLPKKLGEDIQ